MQVKNLLRDLLKIPSPSGEEKKIGKFILKRLEKNFTVETQKVGERFNILSYTGKPEIILNAHLDTVPGELEIREDGNNFYGRGACDTKASIASMIVAAENLVKKGVSDFGLLFNVGEEADFSGVKEALKLINPKYVVIGEPTDFNLVVGQKGLLGIKIKCFGKSASGSTPEKGISAINKLIWDLNKINCLALPENIKLGKTTLNIGKISGGSAVNVVADYAEAIIEFRTTVCNKEILGLLNKEEIGFKVLYDFESCFLKEDLDLNLEKIVVPYFTEMYFWNKKTKAFVLGPGEYKYAHSDEEQIKKNDLERAVGEYERIITYLKQKCIVPARGKK